MTKDHARDTVLASLCAVEALGTLMLHRSPVRAVYEAYRIVLGFRSIAELKRALRSWIDVPPTRQPVQLYEKPPKKPAARKRGKR